MVKPITENETQGRFVPYSITQYGRNYVRRVLGTQSEGYDVAQYNFWRDYLTNIALSAFEWENVPSGIDTREMEYIFLNHGLGGFFEESGGFLFAQCAPIDQWNLYYNPNKVMLYSPVGRTWERHNQPWAIRESNEEEIEYMPRDCVVGYDNMNRSLLVSHIDYYAKRLAIYDRIADINVCAQRTPYTITGPESALKSNQAIMDKLISNEQVLYLNQGSQFVNQVDVLSTGAPYVADKILADQKRILDIAVTLFGADNSNTEKRERVITQEATANNEQIMLMRRSRLECRKRFCFEVNSTFGLDISVKWGVPHMAEPNDFRASDLTGNKGYEDSYFEGVDVNAD